MVCDNDFAMICKWNLCFFLFPIQLSPFLFRGWNRLFRNSAKFWKRSLKSNESLWDGLPLSLNSGSIAELVQVNLIVLWRWH